MIRMLKLSCLGIGLLCIAAPTGPPVVNVDYQKHLKLWRSQRNILNAFENLDQAQREAPRGLGRHADKARELLVQAAQEIKIASMEAETGR